MIWRSRRNCLDPNDRIEVMTINAVRERSGALRSASMRVLRVHRRSRLTKLPRPPRPVGPDRPQRIGGIAEFAAPAPRPRKIDDISDEVANELVSALGPALGPAWRRGCGESIVRRSR
jgi:hypothetical protein